MTQKEKLIEKLLNRPTSLRYNEIIKLFTTDNYIIRQGKWSHLLVINKTSSDYVTVSLHNNDCKDYYKERLSQLYFNNL